jgi:hypothetical protein
VSTPKQPSLRACQTHRNGNDGILIQFNMGSGMNQVHTKDQPGSPIVNHNSVEAPERTDMNPYALTHGELIIFRALCDGHGQVLRLQKTAWPGCLNQPSRWLDKSSSQPLTS